MTEEQQLKLQAFLDGELPDDEAREVISLIARDEEAKALHAELKNTRQAIKFSERSVRHPESREFFWLKIEREIQRLEPVVETKPSISFFEYLRRALVPLSTAAIILIAGILAYDQFRPHGSAETETAMADAGAFTYHDYSKGMTLVWLPFPAENDLAQNGPATTIQ